MYNKRNPFISAHLYGFIRKFLFSEDAVEGWKVAVFFHARLPPLLRCTNFQHRFAPITSDPAPSSLQAVDSGSGFDSGVFAFSGLAWVLRY